MIQSDKTWLFVPVKEKYLVNFEKIESDIIILDLEDSLSLEQKDSGLSLAQEIVSKYGDKRSIYIRINTGERMKKELECLQKYNFCGYIIPKFESPSILEIYAECFEGREVISLIESIRGVMNLEKIAECPLISGLAFGGEDFCKELGFEAGEEATIFARNQVVMYAKYHNKISLDTISLEIRDMSLFKRQYQKSKSMGFDGKLLIHPKQVGVVYEYRKRFDKNKLREIVNIYKKSASAIIQYEGQIYETPHIKKIEQYLLECEEEL